MIIESCRIRHDPELARKEALQARQTHTHRSGQKESGSSPNHFAGKQTSVHTQFCHISQKKHQKKFQISAGTTSENDACGRQDF